MHPRQRKRNHGKVGQEALENAVGKARKEPGPAGQKGETQLSELAASTTINPIFVGIKTIFNFFLELAKKLLF